jgi:hypothetical protein
MLSEDTQNKEGGGKVGYNRPSSRMREGKGILGNDE